MMTERSERTERIEQASGRIKAALARISVAADTSHVTSPSISALTARHEALRDSVASSLEELDALIDTLDQDQPV